MRVILRGPLGYRTRLTRTADQDAEPAFALNTSVVLAIDRFLYRPVTGLALAAAARVRRLQSGRLSFYLLYMLVSLLLALALIPILR